MRMTEIFWFIICFNIAIPLVAATGIFGTGPEGTSIISDYLTIAAAATALAVGGVSIMGWSFKVPAVITVLAAIYAASIAGMDVLIAQIIQPASIAATFAGVFTTIAAIVGVLGLIQIAGGAHGPME